MQLQYFLRICRNKFHLIRIILTVTDCFMYELALDFIYNLNYVLNRECHVPKLFGKIFNLRIALLVSSKAFTIATYFYSGYSIPITRQVKDFGKPCCCDFLGYYF